MSYIESHTCTTSLVLHLPIHLGNQVGERVLVSSKTCRSYRINCAKIQKLMKVEFQHETTPIQAMHTDIVKDFHLRICL